MKKMTVMFIAACSILLTGNLFASEDSSGNVSEQSKVIASDSAAAKVNQSQDIVQNKNAVLDTEPQNDNANAQRSQGSDQTTAGSTKELQVTEAQQSSANQEQVQPALQQPATSQEKVQTSQSQPQSTLKENQNPENTKIVYVYAQPPQKEEPKKEKQGEYTTIVGNNPFLCFGRGITNVLTCWLEIPRCIVYDSKVIPVIGTVMGIPEGAIYTVGRAFVGVIDLVTLGMSGDAMYGKYMPDFVWEANWAPPTQKSDSSDK